MKRPKTLMCYICGREYGTKSLSIHIKQCKEMFLVQENKKPRKDRRNPPSTPPGLMDLLNKDNITLDDISAYNNRAFDKYNYEALVPCQNCGRTFKPESLVHHAKACFPDKPFKPLDRAQAGGEYEDGGGGGQNLVPCSKCGRNFGSDRVGKHESVCKGQQMSSTTASWTKPNEAQQPSQTQPASQKKIKCFVCNKLFIPVVFKTHPQECATRNNYKDEFPPLAGDLMKLTDPSSLLIELYHRSLTEDLLAPKDSHFNTSNNQSSYTEKTNTSAYNNQSIKVTKPSEESNKAVDNQLQQSQLKQSQVGQQKVQTNESSQNLQTGVSNYRKVFVPNSQSPQPQSTHTYQDEEQDEDEQNMSGTFGKGLTATTNQIQNQEQYDSQGVIDEEEDLVRCYKCERKFGADRIDKHQSVCKGQRVSPQKKQAPQVLERKDSKSVDNPKWKQQHEEFQKVMQYNRKVKEIEDKGGDVRQLGPPPKTNDDHLHQCPYCQRKFDPNRIEKHIGICQNVVNKPKAVPNSNNQIPQASQTQNNFKIRTPQKYPSKQSDNERSSDTKQPTRTNPNQNQSYLPPQPYSAKVPTKTTTNFNQNIFQQQQSNQSLLNVKSPQKPRQQKSQDYSNNNSYNGPQSKSANRSGYR